MSLYQLHGLTIDCPFALPPLPTGGGTADVHIEVEEIPDSLSAPLASTASYQVNVTATLITLPRLARFLIDNGTQIRIQPEPGVAAPDLTPVLLGPVWAALLHQRGAFPLTGSLVALDGKGVLICSGPAQGATSMALAMQRQGGRILADEFSTLDTTPDGVLAQPGLPALKVWPDVLDALGLDTDPLQPVRTGLCKRWYPLTPAAPIRLAAVVELRVARIDAEDTGLTRRQGFNAFSAIDRLTWHLAYLRPLPAQHTQFARCVAVAGQAPVLRYAFSPGLHALPDNAERLAQALEAAL